MSTPPRENADFHELFEQHADFVWRVLKRHRVAERELEDACQEVFLVVFRRVSEFDGALRACAPGSTASPCVWPWRIAARHTCDARCSRTNSVR